jgi:hypothetical protein
MITDPRTPREITVPTCECPACVDASKPIVPPVRHDDTFLSWLRRRTLAEAVAFELLITGEGR